MKTNKLSVRTILISNEVCSYESKLSTAFCNSSNINLSSSVYIPEESKSKAFAVVVACDGWEYSVVRWYIRSITFFILSIFYYAEVSDKYKIS